MHRFIAGTCQIELSLDPATTWIVREASRNADGSNRESTDNSDVRLKDMGGGTLLPASSIKGVIRTTAERILRSLDFDRPSHQTPLADLVFGLPEEDLDQFDRMPRANVADTNLTAWQTKNTGAPFAAWEIYREISPASQMFGSTVHAGLTQFSDTRLPRSNAMRRPHVAIDRFSGGVAASFFENLNPSTPLSTSISITNFAFWHLALLYLVFEEVNRGYTAFGAGTRKGHGRMSITTTHVSFTYPAAVYAAGGTGVISAQGWLSARDNLGVDVPEEVAGERGLRLLSGVAPSAQVGDWREEGMVRLDLSEEEITALYREVFQQSWLPWLQRMGVVA